MVNMQVGKRNHWATKGCRDSSAEDYEGDVLDLVIKKASTMMQACRGDAFLGPPARCPFSPLFWLGGFLY